MERLRPRCAPGDGSRHGVAGRKGQAGVALERLSPNTLPLARLRLTLAKPDTILMRYEGPPDCPRRPGQQPHISDGGFIS
jgi:hypothetical protein